MADTNKLGMPLIAADQAQKHVTHNDALQRIDQLVQQTVINRTTTAPPGSPSEGHAYVIASPATGDWVGRENQIAAWITGAWFYFTPRAGWVIWDESANKHFAYVSGAWTDYVAYVTGAKFGWENHQDVTTTTTPIALSLANTWYDMTNDGAGSFTIHTSPPQISGVGPLWDTVAQELDFSTLDVYDEVRFRFDVTVTTTGANRNIDARLAFLPGFVAENVFIERAFKTAGVHQLFIEFSFAMFNAATRDGPAKFQVRSDGTGDSVVVNGWKISVHKV